MNKKTDFIKDIKNEEQIKKEKKQNQIILLMDQVKNILNNKSIDMGYDSITSAVTYINSSNQVYKKDAELLNKWRDKCFEFAINSIENNKSEIIDNDEIIANLPKI